MNYCILILILLKKYYNKYRLLIKERTDMKKYLKLASIVMAFVMVITSVAFVSATNLQAKSKVKSITVKGAKKNMTFKVGESKKFKVKVKAKKGKTGFTVKSSDKAVVKVKKKGKKITVKALKVGNAKVTVRSKKNKKKKYVIKITVTDGKTVQPTVKPAEPTAKPEETTVAPVEPTTKAPMEPTTVAPVETTTAQEVTTAGQLQTQDAIGGFGDGAGDNIDDLIDKP